MLRLHNFAIAVIIVFNYDILVLSSSGQIKKLRGVAPSRKPLYPEKDTFTCIDGKNVIKYDRVNDDYCDCEDASDEPGTSACPNGQFHCINSGYKFKNIPSSRVNDGVCDCCDASDEYDSNANCVNNCLALGREERQLERSRQELIKKGSQLRVELSQRGKSIKLERESRLVDLERRRADVEAIRLEKEKLKKEAEVLENEALEVYRQIQEAEQREKQEKEAKENEQEAEITFIKFDSNKNGLIELNEIQTRVSFDKNRDGEVSEEEAKFFLDNREEVDKDLFLTVCWPVIKPYLMLDSGLFTPPNNEEELPHAESQPDDEAHAEEAELLNSDGDQEQHEEHEEEEEEEDTGDAEVDDQEPVEQSKPEYDPETQALIETANAARNDYTETERTVREIDTEIKDINDAISKDYGRDDEYAPLDGECFNYEDREYVYRLCPFDRTSQQARSGGSETRLGSWEQWKGKENKYSHMLYSHGSSCWNGPQRSALVVVECGLENRVTSVVEPNRCEYQMTFETPAACSEPIVDGDDEFHDEL